VYWVAAILAIICQHRIYVRVRNQWWSRPVGYAMFAVYIYLIFEMNHLPKSVDDQLTLYYWFY